MEKIIIDSNSEKSEMPTNKIYYQEKEYYYQFQNDTVFQEIKIDFLDNNRIDFKYVTKNNIKQCVDTIQGVALNKHPDSDPELDNDEEGFGYPSIEYLYEKGEKVLAIRIAMKTKDKVVINASGFEVSNCQYISIGILRKRNNNNNKW
ncbi:MAG: hypothetical protein A1D16_08385 [Flavihumibacter sp. CACIAM 22H1]|nr:MAG: hypothetical protein A1D16_08385 [Flavihumibacter sp. CACIAM 22H1]